MNIFESGERKVIPAVLVYLWRETIEKKREFLMIHRQGRANDDHLGKWNGLGGKLDAGESPDQAASREIEEESSIRLEPSRFQWLGMLQFPNFKPHKNEDWWCAVMVAQVQANDVVHVENGSRFSYEGTLHWVAEEEILNLNLWEGDRLFLPRVFSGKSFHGTFWYQDQKVVSWSLSAE